MSQLRPPSRRHNPISSCIAALAGSQAVPALARWVVLLAGTALWFLLSPLANSPAHAEAAVQPRVKAPSGQVPMRSAPSVTAPSVGVLRNGAPVRISCQTTGSVVTGPYGTSRIWDRVGNGYVPDAYVHTGSDSMITKRCQSTAKSTGSKADDTRTTVKSTKSTGSKADETRTASPTTPKNSAFDDPELTPVWEPTPTTVCAPGEEPDDGCFPREQPDILAETERARQEAEQRSQPRRRTWDDLAQDRRSFCDATDLPHLFWSVVGATSKHKWVERVGKGVGAPLVIREVVCYDWSSAAPPEAPEVVLAPGPLAAP